MQRDDRVETQLRDLAQNLWWTWDPAATEIFEDLDGESFRGGHSAKAVVAALGSERFVELAADAGFRARLDRVYRAFVHYRQNTKTWAWTHAAPLRVRPVAYFSAEFGLHESLPIYSGGLGILAGDHLKSASDLGLSLVGVGLFYRESYFRQRLDRDGLQHAAYVRCSDPTMPVEPVLDGNGAPVMVEVPFPNETLKVRLWQVHVGRVRLLLLDTDVDGNSTESRALGSRLYYGDQRIRIRQELLLGVGGIRALRAAGIHWGVLHLNEGHSAFATLEQARLRMVATGTDFRSAAQVMAQSTVFTTHTPVDAGHDRFPASLVDEHLEPLRLSLGLTREELLGLGRVDPKDPSEALTMTVLAFKMSRFANAVSSVHGRVTRRRWQVLWPHHREDEVPVGHITNGVHVRSWLAPEMQDLYARHVGHDWVERLTDPAMWARIHNVEDDELWETHRALKARLVDFVRRTVAEQRQREGYPEELVQAAREALAPDALTIGFARRFATYKRGNLLLRDVDRLVRLVTRTGMPVQLVFAGKSHPADRPGQEMLRAVHQACLRPDLLGRVLFVEDHDIDIARHLVQGVDLWLNTPRRPQEASGTSGQKVLLNGGLNLSILDGWWAEAYDGFNGFAIGEGLSHMDVEEQDRRDAEDLYEALEQQVVPLFYQRNERGVPSAWVARMKRAIETLGWRFNTDRMVMDYVVECYLPAAGASSCRMPK